MAEQNDSIRTLAGVGQKKAEMFARLGVKTLGDLLRLYPRDYEDRTKLVTIEELDIDAPACFVASLVTNPQTHTIPKEGGRTLEVTKFTVADDTARLSLTFFNQGYAAGRLQRGETYCFYGALADDSRPAMINPLFEPLGKSGELTRRIMPIYPLTAGLTNKAVMQNVALAFSKCGEVSETLPETLLAQYDLPAADTALHQIHTPSSQEDLARARRRLIFEEFFVFSAALSLLRAQRTQKTCTAYTQTELGDFYAALPFTLTAAQQRAIDDILSDFKKGIPMSRLVQGDVGSGKTMVAAAAAVAAARNGRQTAFMAPTEILAQQHFALLESLLTPLGVRCALLTGSLKPDVKAQLRKEIAQGEYDLVLGTHALLTDATTFSSLGLVITDEQHRFGVNQRAKLSAKGEEAHLLIMSATPIPRTLALIMYGDLDISVIDELPPGRQSIDTFLVDERYRKRLNDFIRKQTAANHQCFIVCPAVEEDELQSLKSAEQWAQVLQTQVFPNLRVSLLHGRMKGTEKEAVMAAFAAHEADILVATTVIEVGVDVPNATLIIIENADRFGLSQLHQLRGRVGRGREKSYCILVSDNKNSDTLRRLKALCATNDGFRLSEEDLALRGPGDFFGSRQHGLPTFRIGNLAQNLALLQQAQEAAAAAIAAGELSPALLHAIRGLLENADFALN
ncbi:MAG: ATP-dependent DNA helicase RecG [Oscillospiraceae bacterium]|jgi:ATP-dependent DNA helicase RecG|nr:ATP-dependent DNA helicase RecG [Oscillospiraceae bacterium]